MYENINTSKVASQPPHMRPNATKPAKVEFKTLREHIEDSKVKVAQTHAGNAIARNRNKPNIKLNYGGVMSDASRYNRVESSVKLGLMPKLAVDLSWYKYTQAHYLKGLKGGMTDGKLNPTKYGSCASNDLGLCMATFGTVNRCVFGAECELRHRFPTAFERRWMKYMTRGKEDNLWWNLMWAGNPSGKTDLRHYYENNRVGRENAAVEGDQLGVAATIVDPEDSDDPEIEDSDFEMPQSDDETES
ncbi:hypothetical protein NX059_000820 [Plenodomus lindquistii]|nr:hypothetical protein NX059_000820 [Plenodomus lindquistii]